MLIRIRLIKRAPWGLITVPCWQFFEKFCSNLAGQTFCLMKTVMDIHYMIHTKKMSCMLMTRRRTMMSCMMMTFLRVIVILVMFCHFSSILPLPDPLHPCLEQLLLDRPTKGKKWKEMTSSFFLLVLFAYYEILRLSTYSILLWDSTIVNLFKRTDGRNKTFQGVSWQS